jgi:hypothetical protein
LWVKDVVDLTWDILRYRRIKAAYAKDRPNPDDPDDSLMLCWSVDRMIGTLERIEWILASAETRRNNALREIERRRTALGRALRQTSDEIIEAEAPLVPAATG